MPNNQLDLSSCTVSGDTKARSAQQFLKVLPPFIAILLFLSFPISLAAANVLMLLLIIAFIASGDYRKRWDAIRNSPPVIFALVLYAVVVFGITYTSATWSDVTLHLNKYSKLFVIAIVFSVLDSRNWQRRCMLAFALAMLFILASTWLNVWFQLPWSKTQTPGWGVSHHVVGDYITQNVMMAFFVLQCLVHAFEQRRIVLRAGWLLIALLAAISITHLTQGRTGFVLLSVALGAFVLGSMRGKMAWLTLAALVAGLGASAVSSPLMTERFIQAVDEAANSDSNNQSSIGHRLYNYKVTTQLVQEKPLFGWGTGAYHTQICAVVERPEWCQVFSWHPHNQYLFFATDHGAIGLLAYLALIGALVALALRDENQSSRCLLLGFAALLAVNSLFNSPMWSSRESHFFTLMLALLVAKSSGRHVFSSGRPNA